MPKVLKASRKPSIISDLKDLVYSNAKEYGDKVLYYYKDKDTKKLNSFSYNDMLYRMNALGTAFSKLGIMGTHIAVIGETHPDYMTTYFACANGGGTIVPLDREISIDEIVNFCDFAEITAIAYTSSFNGKLTSIADKFNSVKYFIPIETGEPVKNENVFEFEDLIKLGALEIENGNRTFVDYEVKRDDLAAILFTSGTTGTSKGVMLSQGNLAAATNASCICTEYDPSSVFVSALPIHHTYECTCGQFAAPHCGGTIYINDSLKNALRNFNAFKPNSLILVPLFVETMYKKIWAEIDKKGMHKKVRAAMKVSDALLKVNVDMRSKFFSQITGALGGNLVSIVCGGAPIDKNILKDFYSFGISIFEGYGITECAPLVAVNRPGEEKYGSVGRPVYGCQVKIDKEYENADTGEILVKGDNVMLGYYKNEEATKEVFTEDGWFRTGDIGYLDDDGFIFITGRKKNVIILSNGKNVFPEEVESYLLRSEYINEVVVIGRLNANRETVITAVVYPEMESFKDKTDDEIYAIIKDEVNRINHSIPSFKQVHEIEIRKEEFEKTTSKKIKRFLVK